MNGPDHYREGERLLANAERAYADSDVSDPYPNAAHLVQMAKAHFAAAQVAASITHATVEGGVEWPVDWNVVRS